MKFCFASLLFAGAVLNWNGCALVSGPAVVAPALIEHPEADLAENLRPLAGQSELIFTLVGLVSARGDLLDAVVLSSDRPAANEEVLEHLRACRFEPGRVRGWRSTMQVGIELHVAAEDSWATTTPVEQWLFAVTDSGGGAGGRAHFSGGGARFTAAFADRCAAGFFPSDQPAQW